jgi:tRNA (guanine37-N1)-methyltransferase
VPEVLRNGDHSATAKWRRQESLRITYQRRPDLIEKATLSKEDKQFIENLQ